MDGQNILLFGLGGGITRSTDGGASFEPVLSGVSERLFGVVVDGQNILLFGAGGVITRSTDSGASFEPVPSGVNDNLWEAIVDGQNILLAGSRGTITRSTDGGASFEPILSGVNASLFGAVVDGQNILLFGSGGAIVAVDDRWADALRARTISNGSEGDTILGAFLDDELPTSIQAELPVADSRRALSIIEARRDVLEALGADTQDKLNTLRDAPALLKRDEVRQTFVDFLAVCRGEDEERSQELTKACLDSWQAQQTAERQNWWQTLAVQVPPGVLLLFLLATLGALYRYSLRMAGFYHSRADALELLHAGIVKNQQIVLSALALDLAADKVEFGRANTPADQAVELAKVIAGRR
ncbi:WD40/YVTN/BNR-like repeat-containing protein [Leisingera aquaemixtae]|uniref:WD40/YVTN/BNR-like repeat-containing protein n=1 Tax=Leisingera aquaemixtae TaxID=1396826 RepID=UPI00071DA488|nr:hypothetical protein [Leisingera aquaemixtae]